MKSALILEPYSSVRMQANIKCSMNGQFKFLMVMSNLTEITGFESGVSASRDPPTRLQRAASRRERSQVRVYLVPQTDCHSLTLQPKSSYRPKQVPSGPIDEEASTATKSAIGKWQLNSPECDSSWSQ